MTQRGSTLSCLFRTAGVCPPRAVCFASVYTCVSVSMCSLAPSVSGIPSPEHTLWFYYRSMFAVKLLHRLARTCPAQGRGTGEPMLALWEAVGRHHLHTWGPRPLAAQVAAGWPREAKRWAPGYGRVCPGPSPSAPGSPEETWGCSHHSPPRSQAPSPSPFFCLRRSRPAQTCLLFSPAGS